MSPSGGSFKKMHQSTVNSTGNNFHRKTDESFNNSRLAKSRLPICYEIQFFFLRFWTTIKPHVISVNEASLRPNCFNGPLLEGDDLCVTHECLGINKFVGIWWHIFFIIKMKSCCHWFLFLQALHNAQLHYFLNLSQLGVPDLSSHGNNNQTHLN